MSSVGEPEPAFLDIAEAGKKNPKEALRSRELGAGEKKGRISNTDCKSKTKEKLASLVSIWNRHCLRKHWFLKSAWADYNEACLKFKSCICAIVRTYFY